MNTIEKYFYGELKGTRYEDVDYDRLLQKGMYKFRDATDEELEEALDNAGNKYFHHDRMSTKYRNSTTNYKQLISNVAARVASIRKASIDGMSKRQASIFINKLFRPHMRGIYRDPVWKPVQAMFKAMRDNNIDYYIESAEYSVSPSLRQTYNTTSKTTWDTPNDNKTWKFTIEFEDNNGRNKKLYGHIVASGAGSIEDPLEKYDVVGYVS